MHDALLEIGCEELPVSYIKPALEQMRGLAEDLCSKKMLRFSMPAVTAATPRRLILILPQVADKSVRTTQRIAGPPERMLKDDHGDYTMAAVGFAKKCAIPVQELKCFDGKVCAEIEVGGEKARKILAQIFPEIIQSIRFPKTMMWEKTGFRFARPVRNIVALIGSDTIKFTLAGIKSGKTTYGLYTAGMKKIDITNADSFSEILRSKGIRTDHHDRKEYMKRLMTDVLGAGKERVIEDDELLDENVFLVEMPSVVAGNFDLSYLELPREILITCMRTKQKFFSVLDESGRLINRFIGFRNGPTESHGSVREGFERVLTARLEDAKFFYEHDKKNPLSSMTEQLTGVMFHEKLGTVYDKIHRMRQLIEQALSHGLPMNHEQKDQSLHAAQLAKADLVSALVFEYPELQGIAGRLYAAAQGIDPDICQAIEDHYKPLGPHDSLPVNVIGSCVALADKCDSLAGYFLAGIIPSGNKDPFGLRRQALGIIRIILDNQYHIDC
ncbi:MAG: glycine--tRNA ligase subunit beta, partial [Elusimicrobia bacterium]|nr:glycine--tRNA ligase subunit beta [Elusimicrobiota bacterium]MBD3412710.1 glycine--tRNA ligase subunit beta [Elusimicrobiota bacterium]